MGERRPACRRLLPRRAALLAAALLVMAGCGGGGAALPAQDAVAQYEVVAEDVLGALTAVRPLAWERGAQGVIEPGAQDCRYRPGIWTADDVLYPEPGQGRDWGPWREALDPVLEEHGFTPLGREQSSGAAYWLESKGPSGSRLQLYIDGELRITDVRVDAEPCEDETLGL